MSLRLKLDASAKLLPIFLLVRLAPGSRLDLQNSPLGCAFPIYSKVLHGKCMDSTAKHAAAASTPLAQFMTQ
jgi:hypothetical protein